MQYRAMAAGILLALNFPCAAQDMQRVEVTGSNTAQRRDDAAAVGMVSRDELLRHGDRSLADALRRVPGITVAETSGGSEIRMRGLGKGYTGVLLNGAPLPPGFSIDALAPAMIERVEIIHTASAELAAQGIAGTVNIILRRQSGRARHDARLGVDVVGGAGPWNPVVAPSGSWQWAGSEQDLDWSLNGALSRTAQLDSGTELHRESGPGGAPALWRSVATAQEFRPHALSLSPRVTWKRPGGSLAWQGFASVAERTNRYRADETTLLGSPTAYPASGSWLDIRGVMLRSELTWQQEVAEGVKAQAKLGLQHYPRRSDFDFFSTEGGARRRDIRHVHSDIRESTATASGKIAFSGGAHGNHAVAVGWDAEAVLRTQSRAERDDAAGTATDDRYRGHIGRAALFVQDEWAVSDAWSMSAGLRWEMLRTAVSPNGGAQVAQRSSVASPLLQSLYKWTATRRVRAGLSRTYKTPAMLELIPRRYTVDNGNSQNNPDNQGNPLLRPELAWGLDIALEQDIGGAGVLSASLYRRRIDDVNVPLLFEDQGRWVRTPHNLGRADTWGAALEFKAALSPRWTVRAHAARDASRVAAVPGPDNRLARQAPRGAAAGFDYRWHDGLTVGADLAWQDGGWARESAVVAARMAASRKLDLYAAWRLGADTRLRVSGANLLARDTVTGSTYTGGGVVRALSERTRATAVLRFNLEHRW